MSGAKQAPVADQPRDADRWAVYLVTDANQCAASGRSVPDTVSAAVAAGVRAIQVRAKDAHGGGFLEEVLAVADALAATPGGQDTALIVNDRIDVALAARAAGARVDGVHVGQSDLPAGRVREMLWPGAILGVSVGEPAEAAAAAPHADYLGVGPVVDTATKPDARASLGLGGVAAVCAASPLPCVAIGGIDVAATPHLRAVGAAGVAIVSGICAHPDPGAASTAYLDAWRSAKNRPPSARAEGRSMPASARPHLGLPRVLSIAGTDPTGGAGTAADLKSITAAGGYGMAVVTSLVAQNTRGVRGVHLPPIAFLNEQLAAVSDDVELDAVKTGMLATADIIAAVGAWLDAHAPAVLVVDPVMVATSGDRLLDADAEAAMRAFCRRATVMTPNTDELAVLTHQRPATTQAEAIAQARGWAQETGTAIVVKTGHLHGPCAANIWVGPHGEIHRVDAPRIETTATHGTGCSLASALATRLGSGESPADALGWATRWLSEAIANGADQRVGSGHGPVDHAHRARRLQRAADPRPWTEADAVPRHWHHPDDVAPGLTPDAAACPPAGPWTSALWRAAAPVRARIAASSFVTGLLRGTLDQESFAFYLSQDAAYLTGYARALAALAVRAPSAAQAALWASASAHCELGEAELHRTWLANHSEPLDARSGPITDGYVWFLIGHGLASPYVVGAAAALPCMWLYAQTGADAGAVPQDHPYGAWIATYQDPEALAATTDALGVVEDALERASALERSDAARAFLTACRHEAEFFDQATRRG